jgi:hypothetical protein
MWRPQLSDAADELILEAAVNGQAARHDEVPASRAEGRAGGG